MLNLALNPTRERSGTCPVCARWIENLVQMPNQTYESNQLKRLIGDTKLAKLPFY